MQRTEERGGAQSERRLKRLFWSICLVGWLSLVAVTSSFVSVVTTLPFFFAMQLALGFWGFYALATPLALWLARRFPLNQRSWRTHVPVHLLGSIAFITISEGGFLGMIHLFEPRAAKEMNERHRMQETSPTQPAPAQLQRPGRDPFDNGLPDQSLPLVLFKSQFGIPVYWVLVGVAHSLAAMVALRERERQAAQLTALLTQAQLAGLRTQLQPHFLFNTLNSIAALIPHNAKLATEMVMNLSDLLRMTLRDPKRGEIRLREELQLLRHYVDIQRLRFGERLDFHLEATDDALDTLVPPLLLQPLVENAIRHGVEASDRMEQITVRAQVADCKLYLEVANTFHRKLVENRPPPNSTGVGLANTQARLRVQYGDQHSFQAGPSADGGFQVTMTFPIHPMETLSQTTNHND